MSLPISRRTLLATALAPAAASLGVPRLALAQAADWPKGPVRLTVPFPAGGGVDNVARLLFQRVSEQIGQPVVIENQGGGGGTIASAALARAPADGHHLIFHSVSGAVVNAVTLKNLRYDPINDFAPVTLASRFPLVVVISPTVPAQNIEEFIALARANPGKYSYGSSGVGTSIHIAGELFNTLAGTQIQHVPYKGTVAVMPDLLAGRVHMLIDGVPPQLPHISAGRVRALAVTTTTRSEVLPKVPALNEVLPGYDIPFWTGVFAPARTPQPVLERIASEVRKATQHPEVARKLKETGTEGVGSSPAEFEAYWRKQLTVYDKIVKDANIKVES
ncbi:tripartite tricarboxylate transporter substrate binding protein [Ramlibacter sp. AW1]|uniref:Tripartite tricarboxylate transporter substrate binding protein n=1 Tax=Ramlibacter aurantiacus TaxID=2801330 RepID=A0A937D931_9BURK|nr:tripartite tricarboxylate transporter substrate binding protein [Ramlibacter aurantiacus]MBL0422706.1 tripartite tricarboxylate transporter substrate binding protein [Ramlibacter aurantiacus]